MLLKRVLQAACQNHASRVSQARLIHQSLTRNVGENVQSTQSGHVPDIWDKRMLVWMRKYPNVEAVPSVVAPSTMDKARNQVRIRANLFLCVMTGVVSYFVYQYGKKKTLAGENFYTRHEVANAKPSSS